MKTVAVQKTMKALVIGSGVIGLTSAWYLRQAGFDVTVIDRQAQAALETSYANAGQLSYGYSAPWAAPGVPQKALKWLVQTHAPLKISPPLNAEMVGWSLKMLANCNTEKYQQNKSRMLRLANYSKSCLSELKDRLPLNFEGKELGTLQVFRHASQLDSIGKDMHLLAQSGVEHHLLNVEQCIQKEPGLAAVKEKLTGGLYLPNDETGDCYLFCQQLEQECRKAGIEFHYLHQVKKIEHQSGQVTKVVTDKQTFVADKYVFAMGSHSATWLKTLGINLPVYPVKGYSLTVPIEDSKNAPTSTVMDETYKVAITRFENRIRVAGTAELAGFSQDLPHKRTRTISKVLTDLFPKASNVSKAEYWTGLRPMTPDGTPVIGKTPLSNAYTNTGHGTLGWTLACGSGKLLADIVAEKKADIQHDDLSYFRYVQ